MTDVDLLSSLSAPGRTNPHAEQAEERFRQWSDSLGLCPSQDSRNDILCTQVGYCMGLYYPDAPLNLLTLLCKLGGWAVMIDDELDVGPGSRDPAVCLTIVTGLVETFEDPSDRPGRPAMERAAAGMWRELAPSHSVSWTTRFLTHMTNYLWGHYTCSLDHAIGRMQHLEEYRERRREIFATPWLLQLCESVVGHDLPDAVHRLPAFRTLFTTVSEVSYLDNDRVSLPRELATGVHDNTAILLRHHEGLSLEQAVARIDRMIAACDRRIVTAHHELPAQLACSGLPEPTVSAALRCADGYLDYVRGHRWYSATSTRYHGNPPPPGSSFGEGFTAPAVGSGTEPIGGK